jgi:GcrA cell cycle regulator
MGWSKDRVEILRKLWDAGHSASVIAARLGGTTRNAVISKVHRLGLSGRAVVTRTKRSYVSKAKRLPKTKENHYPTGNPAFRKLCADAAPLIIADEIDIPVAERKRLVDLEAQDCRWPIGSPSDPFPDFYFCGQPKVDGLPYCPSHCRRAFQPPEMRKRHVAKAKEHA